MAKGFKYVNHTADVEFRSYGKSVQVALRNAFIALFNTLAYTDKLSKSGETKRTAVIRLSSESAEELIWMALQRAVSIGDARGLLFYKAKVKLEKRGGKILLSAKLEGKPERPEYAKFDVKGVSKYNLSVSQTRGGYVVDVVVDV